MLHQLRLWHRRLDHINIQKLQFVFANRLVIGLPPQNNFFDSIGSSEAEKMQQCLVSSTEVSGCNRIFGFDTLLVILLFVIPSSRLSKTDLSAIPLSAVEESVTELARKFILYLILSLI